MPVFLQRFVDLVQPLDDVLALRPVPLLQRAVGEDAQVADLDHAFGGLLGEDAPFLDGLLHALLLLLDGFGDLGLLG